MWIPDGGLNDFQEEIIGLHLRCLNRYKNIFDEQLFVFSTNNVEGNIQLIYEYEKSLINFNIKKLSFKIIDNHEMQEAITFREDIINHLGDFDGMTFFAHSKGLSNDWADKESLKRWICFMYFMNLEYVQDCETAFVKQGKCVSGTLLEENPELPNQNKWFYSGGFYWINELKLKELLGVSSYIALNDRMCGEMFWGNLFKNDFKYNHTLGEFFYQKTHLDNKGLFNFFDEFYRYFCNDENEREFNNFYEEIKSI